MVHRTGCVMLTFADDGLKREVEEDPGLRPPFALEAFGDLDQEVRQSVARIEGSPFVPHHDAVRGFVQTWPPGSSGR